MLLRIRRKLPKNNKIVEYSLFNILLFSVAALVGTFARFGLNTGILKILGQNFPWGIFIVNILGCFGFGLIWASNEQILNIDDSAKNALLIGFMGAFTTFSTFIFDCDNLIKAKKWLAVIANVVGQILLGLFAFVLAVKLISPN